MDHHVPCFGFHPYQELITAHSGIADQDVYASKRLDDIVKSCRRGRVVGNVKLADLAGAAHLLQGRYHLFGGLTLACAGHHDTRPSAPKSERDRSANTA